MIFVVAGDVAEGLRQLHNRLTELNGVYKDLVEVSLSQWYLTGSILHVRLRARDAELNLIF